MMNKSSDYMISIFNGLESVIKILEYYVESADRGVCDQRESLLFFMRMEHDLNRVLIQLSVRD